MRQAVIQALADDEFASAKSEAERLVARQPSDRESALLLAQAADGLEDETTVKRMLPKFAPPDDRGLPEGHLWRAERLLKRADATSAELEEAETHLRRILEFSTLLPRVELRLCQACYRLGKLREGDELAKHLTEAQRAAAKVWRGMRQKRTRDGKAAETLAAALPGLEAQLRQAPTDVEFRALLAEALAGLDRYRDADRILQEGVAIGLGVKMAAPLARLHLEWAERPRLETGAPSRREILEQGLAAMRIEGTGSAENRALTAALLVALGDNAGAIAELRLAARKSADAAPMLANLLRQAGELEEARATLDRSMPQLQARLLEHPLDPVPRIAFAAALVANDRHAEATAMLAEGYSVGKNEALRPALAAAQVAWWDAAEAKRVQPPAEPLALLREAAGWDPWNTDVLSRLRGRTEPAAIELRKRLLAPATPSAATHFAIGVDAHASGDAQAALKHFEAAHRLAPANAIAANNLAALLAKSPKPDLPRAKAILDVALADAPGALELKATRGRILAATGKWAEAVTDLEPCLASKRGDPAFHELLATAYAAAGMPELAHAQLAEAAAWKAAATEPGALKFESTKKSSTNSTADKGGS